MIGLELHAPRLDRARLDEFNGLFGSAAEMVVLGDVVVRDPQERATQGLPFDAALIRLPTAV